MKNNHKDGAGIRAKNSEDDRENKRVENRREDVNNLKDEESQRNQTANNDNTDALSQGYFPDGPGGNYTGV